MIGALQTTEVWVGVAVEAAARSVGVGGCGRKGEEDGRGSVGETVGGHLVEVGEMSVPA
jgi:hypothetical protein